MNSAIYSSCTSPSARCDAYHRAHTQAFAAPHALSIQHVSKTIAKVGYSKNYIHSAGERQTPTVPFINPAQLRVGFELAISSECGMCAGMLLHLSWRRNVALMPRWMCGSCRWEAIRHALRGTAGWWQRHRNGRKPFPNAFLTSWNRTSRAQKPLIWYNVRISNVEEAEVWWRKKMLLEFICHIFHYELVWVCYSRVWPHAYVHTVLEKEKLWDSINATIKLLL